VLVCDTGPLVAAANRRDTFHQDSLDLLETYPGPVLVPSLVVAEVGYLTRTQVGPEAEAMFLDSIADNTLEIVELTKVDWLRTRELVRQYLDMKLGTVDAAVIAIAERLKVTTVATLNARHFRAVRPAHVEAFRLLPLDGMR
jgi:predicted nucleic acid-binding protein